VERNSSRGLISVVPQLVDNVKRGSSDTRIAATNKLVALAKDPIQRQVVFDTLVVNRTDSFSQRDQILKAVRVVIQDPSLEDDVVKNELLPKLIAFFREGTDEQKIQSLHIMAIISGKNEASRAALRASNLTRDLVNLLKENENSKLKLQVERMVVELSKDSPTTAGAFCDAGAIPEFVSLLRKGTELHFVASQFLGMLASHSETDKDRLDAEAIHEFLENIREGNEKVRFSSGVILRKMARHCTPAQLEAIVQSGMINELVDLLDDGSNAQREEAMWILAIFCEKPELRDIILATNAISLMVNLFENGDEVEKYAAFWNLEIMCKDLTLRNEIFAAGAIPALVTFLKQGEFFSSPAALQVLDSLKHDPALDGEGSITQITVLSCLIRKIRSGSAEDVKHAGEILLVLAKGASHDHLKYSFAESGAITILLDTLQPTNRLGSQLTAAKVLRVLAKESSLRRDILRSGLELLVLLVRDAPVDLKIAVGRVLGIMGKDMDMHEEVFNSGLPEVLLGLIHHEHGNPLDTNDIPHDVKLLSVELLSVLCASETAREKLVQKDIIHQLKHLTHHETGYLCERAKELIKKCQGQGWLKKTMLKRFSLKK